MNDKKRNIGLVLSGGGVRGIAHIGAIKALLENNIVPDVVSGSSAGAIVGALYCSGKTPEQMMEFFKEIPLFSLNRFAFSKPGFIDTDKFYGDFKKYLGHDAFDDLKRKLYVSTVDLCNGHLTVFESGELIRPLLASSAFPGLFSPVEIAKGFYADGGILDNFPIAPIATSCKFLIGIHASPLCLIHPEKLKYSVNVLERAIRINYSKRSLVKFEQCQLLIKPDALEKYGLLDVGKMDEIYEIGYNAALEIINNSEVVAQLQYPIKK